MSGNSYRRSSISCLGLAEGSDHGPAIAPTEPNKSFPILPLLSIFGRVNEPLIISKLFWVDCCLGILLLNEIF